MEAKEEREVISYQHGYQDGKKAGEKYALSKEGHEAISYLEGHQDGEKKGIDKGRKEVVEWIEGHKGAIGRSEKRYLFLGYKWQAKLKEWGL